MVKLGPISGPGAAAPVAAPADPRQQDLERALAGRLGKAVRADVVSKLSDGSYLVRVADTTARMMLPPGTQPGTALQMRLLAITPRAAFQLDAEQAGGKTQVVYADAGDLPAAAPARAAPEGGAQVHISSATLAQARADASLPGGAPEAAAAQAAQGPRSHAAVLLSRAPLIAASQLPTLDATSVPAQLSEGARMIGDVLASAARNPAPPTAVLAPLPLLDPGVAPDARHLAHLLKDAVGRSGLFYESHLREWNSGQRELADIKNEPQNQGPAPRHPAADPASAGFVNLQLQTQEEGRVAWTGQLLPGQPLEWDVTREPADEDSRPGAEDDGAWRSGLKLRFKGLGDIGASIVLSGGHIHLKLDTGSGQTASLLRSHAGALATAMEAAGAPLGSFSVRGADE